MEFPVEHFYINSGDLNEEATYIAAYIFENERRIPFFGFSSSHLLPIDRLAFSDLSGEYGSSKFEDIRSQLSIPKNYVWEIHTSQKSDCFGWYYAFDFNTFKDSLTSGKNQPDSHSLVRRRLWIAVPHDDVLQNIKNTSQADIRSASSFVDDSINLRDFSSFFGTAKTVLHAAQKFKSLSLKSQRPIRLTMIGAHGLRAADWNGKSDPYVIVTAHSTKFGEAGAQKYQTATSVKSKTLTPTWNESFLLPSVDFTYKLCFTVVDHDHLSKDDFLGQAVLCISQLSIPLRKQEVEIPLRRMVYRPKKPNASNFHIDNAKSPGKGYIKFMIEPLPYDTSMCGTLMASKVGSRATIQDWIFGESNDFHRTFVVLTGDQIVLYDSSRDSHSLRSCSPIQTIHVNNITSLVDKEDAFELTEGKHGTTWRFRCDDRMGTLIENHKQRKEWLHRLSLSSQLDVLSTAEAILARKESLIEMAEIGKELLKTGYSKDSSPRSPSHS